MSAKMINCKSCGNEIASNAKTCPGCGAKNSKPIFKKWWFWLIIVLFIGGILGSSTDDNDTTVEGSKTVAADGNATSEQVNTETWKRVFMWMNLTSLQTSGLFQENLQEPSLIVLQLILLLADSLLLILKKSAFSYLNIIKTK